MIKNTLFLILPLIVCHGHAQESTDLTEIERISVLGDFRPHDWQIHTASTTIVSEALIEQRAAAHLEELLAVAPNVNFASATSRARYFQIRGIGERAQYKAPLNSSVGLMIDGVDFSGIGTIATLFDIKQVEFFRGPQGTRFGSNALAGLINITTQEPSDVFSGKLKLMAGNYGTYNVNAMLAGPATNTLNYRLALSNYKSDGFYQNTHLERDDTNNRDEFGVRAKMSWAPSDEFNLSLSLFHIDINNGFDAYSLDNDRKTRSDQLGSDQQRSDAVSARIDYSAFKHFDVISLITAANSDIVYSFDQDWSYTGFHPYGYSAFDAYLRDHANHSTELRLVSKPDQQLLSHSTNWLFGLYANNKKQALHRQYTYLPTDFYSDYNTSNLALYGQLDSQLTEKLSLTTGLRLEKLSTDYSDNNWAKGSPQDTMLGGKLSLSYQHHNELDYYASISRGYKGGGYNSDPALGDENRQFNPEYLWNYELGSKLRFDNGAGYIGVSAFYMERQKMQFTSSYVFYRDDGSLGYVDYTANAAYGHNLGVELESNWQLKPELNIYLSLGLLETRFSRPLTPDINLLTRGPQPHAPNYQFHLGLNYQFFNHWQLNLNIEGKDDFYTSDRYPGQISNYQLVNAAISYQAKQWQLKVWARNLLDTDYAVRGFASFGNDPRKGYQTEPYYQWGEPRVFGISWQYGF